MKVKKSAPQSRKPGRPPLDANNNGASKAIHLSATLIRLPPASKQLIRLASAANNLTHSTVIHELAIHGIDKQGNFSWLKK